MDHERIQLKGQSVGFSLVCGGKFGAHSTNPMSIAFYATIEHYQIDDRAINRETHGYVLSSKVCIPFLGPDNVD
jgi:hypothetical protein